MSLIQRCPLRGVPLASYPGLPSQLATAAKKAVREGLGTRLGFHCTLMESYSSADDRFPPVTNTGKHTLLRLNQPNVNFPEVLLL